MSRKTLEEVVDEIGKQNTCHVDTVQLVRGEPQIVSEHSSSQGIKGETWPVP